MSEFPKLSVSIAEQTLTIQLSTKEKRTYSISTAALGAGQQSGSEQTPLGKHCIRAKIGAGAKEGAVFVGRRPTGEIYSQDLANKHPNRDWILTRIMWLSGMEPGFNRMADVDSMRRYIYIHGTPDTEPMGIPASHGCIRMRNKDVMELFDLTPPGSKLIINNN